MDYTDQGTNVGRHGLARTNWIVAAPWARLSCVVLAYLSTIGACTGLSTAAENSTDVRSITYRMEEQPVTVTGEVLKEYGDGSLLILAPDGRLLMLDGTEIIEESTGDHPMQIASLAQVIDSLQAQLGTEFKFYETRHYLIAYNTHSAYAEWVGQLFERLYRGFTTYWKSRDLKQHEPRFPMVAIVFSDKASYLAYSERDIGESARSMFGYYNMNTNRMVMYDLTGVDGLVSPKQRVSTQALINQVLSQPQSERTVATIVHEAVHQLSFNSGLQVRLADNPLWLSEGLAMYFESPDLRSPQGWKMGNINFHNFRLFAQYVGRRSEDSLRSLIRDDQRFKDATTVADSYSESWALTYFLMKARSKQFSAYLSDIGQLEPLEEADADLRIELFEKHFGDLAKLDRDFIVYMRKLR